MRKEYNGKYKYFKEGSTVNKYLQNFLKPVYLKM